MIIHRSTTCVAFLLSPCTRHFHQRRWQLPLLRPWAHTPSCSNTALCSTHQDTPPTVQAGSFDLVGDVNAQHAETGTEVIRGPLSLTLDELSDVVEGSGRAAVIWDCLRNGVDPNLYYTDDDGIERDVSDDAVADAWLAATSQGSSAQTSGDALGGNNNILSGRRQGQGLGNSSRTKLQSLMRAYCDSNNGMEQLGYDEIYTIENSVASLSYIKVSPDGTTKLLLKMRKDGLEVESVIIPWMEKGFSTLCVSSQVGCRQGCTFCATGRMGKLRSLTADEILVQMYYAAKVCRVTGAIIKSQTPESTSCLDALPKVDNIVFMGMGEPADAADAVLPAVNALVDRRMFGIAQSKVTISTVAPDPDAFVTLGTAPAALAWSVHAVDDSLRRSLVPTTRYTMEELKAGLVQALSARSNKLRRTMLEVALIDGVNDSDEDAKRLGDFAQSIMDEVAGSKVVVNLIPYNSIEHPSYRTPPMKRVSEFQKVITDCGVLCYVRTTRGDDDSSACGQLATKRRRGD